MFSTYFYKIHFWFHFFYYQTIDSVFLKTLPVSIIVGSCSFCNFHGFGEEPLTLRNQYVRKLISLGYICRNEFSFISIILNIWWQLTILFRLFSKFRENVIWQWKLNLGCRRKYFSGKRFKAFACKKLITACNIDGVKIDFRKTIISKKVTSVTKSSEFSRILCHI